MPAFEKRIQIRGRDLSRSAHVHTAVYLSYVMEVVREYLEPILGTGYVMARAELDYKAEAVLADRELVARLVPERIGTSSISVAVDLSKTTGEPVLDCRCVFVAVDGGSARPVSDQERTLLAEAMTA